MAMNPACTLLAATSLVGNTHIFQIPANGSNDTPVELGRLEGHTASVNCCVFLDDTTLVTGSDDRCVRVWNAPKGECLQASKPVKDCINKVAPVMVGGATIALVCGCDDGTVVTLSVPELEVVDRFVAAGDTINDVIVVPADGKLVLLTASEDGAVRVWGVPQVDVASGKVVAVATEGDAAMEDRLVNSIDEFTAPVNHIHLFYINGPSAPPLLLMASGENIFGAYFNAESGTLSDDTLHWGGHGDYVRGVHLFEVPELGWHMLSVSDDATAVVQPLHQASGGKLRRYKLHNEMIMALCASPEGVVATGSEDGSARLWRMPFPDALDVTNLDN